MLSSTKIPGIRIFQQAENVQVQNVPVVNVPQNIPLDGPQVMSLSSDEDISLEDGGNNDVQLANIPDEENIPDENAPLVNAPVETTPVENIAADISCVYGVGNTNSHQIINGSTHDGLPFQLVVDGDDSPGDDGSNSQEQRDNRVKFINTHVLRLINKYAIALSEREEPSANVMTRLAKEIETLRVKHAKSIKFALSIAINYERKGKQHCAALGLGNTGQVLRSSTGGTISLVSPDLINNQVIRFGTLRSDIKVGWNIQVKDVEVAQGDEMVAYTNHFSSKRFSECNSNISDYQRFDLKNFLVDDDSCLFVLLKNAKKDVDDSYMIGTVMIPAEETRQKLIKQAYDESKASLQTLIVSMLDIEEGEKIQNLLDAITALEKAGIHPSELNLYLEKSINVMSDPSNQEWKQDLAYEVDDLLKRNKNPNEKHALLWKALGIALMVAGGLTVILGVVVAVGGFAAAGVPGGMAGMAIGSIIGTAGMGLFAGGYMAYKQGRKIDALHDAANVMRKFTK